MKINLIIIVSFKSILLFSQSNHLENNSFTSSYSFLKSEIKNQFSFDYYWVDSAKQKINYNELSYESIDNAILAFDSIKRVYKKIKPIIYNYKDFEKISNDDLKNHLLKILETNYYHYNENIFNEFLLPYKVTIEPIQNWYNIYKAKFNFLNKKLTIKEQLLELKTNINNWFLCTYGIEKRKEPLPRLGALHILQRKKGLCEDAATLVVYALRSQGIAAAVDFVPAWATASGNHTLNTVFDENNKPIHFDVLNTENKVATFVREPGKVFRYTYSKQKNTIAAIYDSKYIPDCFLKNTNYIDVTNEYWKTRDFSIAINNDSINIVYAGVWNESNWKVIWWGKNNKGKLNFTNMGIDAVYMPLCFNGKKLFPCGNPIVNEKSKAYEILLDTTTNRNIEVNSDGIHLNIKIGETYTLYYWNNKWVKHQAIEVISSSSLNFANVPKQALFLITTKTPNLKNRPFVINKSNNIVWY